MKESTSPTGPLPTPLTPIERSERFEQYTAWPVFVASIVFFGATVAMLSASIHDPATIHAARVVAIIAYLLVILDLLVRMVIARKDLRGFLRRYWVELVTLPLPLVRPFVIIVYLWRLPAFRRSGATLRARLLITTFLFMFMFVYFISSAVWLVERGTPGANIVNLDDAIWWGFSTLSTVGYGDFVPITAVGRTLAVCLMMGGIAIVGTTTALIVNLLGEEIHRRHDQAGADAQPPGEDPRAARPR